MYRWSRQGGQSSYVIREVTGQTPARKWLPPTAKQILTVADSRKKDSHCLTLHCTDDGERGCERAQAQQRTQVGSSPNLQDRGGCTAIWTLGEEYLPLPVAREETAAGLTRPLSSALSVWGDAATRNGQAVVAAVVVAAAAAHSLYHLSPGEAGGVGAGVGAAGQRPRHLRCTWVAGRGRQG